MPPLKFHPGTPVGPFASDPARTMNGWEVQHIFREMVVTELRRSPLNRMRRKRIIQFAAALGINPIQAGKLVQQAHVIAGTESRRSTRSIRFIPAHLQEVDYESVIEQRRFVIWM